MNNRAILSLIFCMTLTIFGIFTYAQNILVHAQTAPSTRDDLENRIKTKSSELEQLNRELEAKQEALRTTKDARVSLQKELSTIQYNINQLELSIKADELSVQKLGLEVDSLNYDIRDIQLSIETKKEGIGRLIQQMHERDGENLLIVFLKNSSLSAGLTEAHNITSVKEQLRKDVEGLSTLEEQLSDKLGQVSAKKQAIEVQKKNRVARKAIVEDQKEVRAVVLAETKNKEAVYQKEVSELKKQQDAIADEITAVENELRKTFDVSLLPAKRPGVFVWPITLVSAGGKGRVTQHYGEISNLYRGKPHNGVDIGAPIGTPVFAADEGTVIAVDNNDRSATRKYQYGKYVLIRHLNGMTTIYAHLSRQVVLKGATVKRGEIIGYSGSTGYATGPHLHFGVYWSQSVLLKPVSPAAGLVPVGVVVDGEDYL
jgi:murein DD-endopeptidase MepM/ murein hydrolase activator NlpD